jgi:O-antigen/teichoic acid export membrane protein
MIFGPEFSGVKKILLMLSPGILAMAGSTVLGHYFAAFGEMKILIATSAVGVVFTALLSFLFIPSLHIAGACIASSGAHLAASAILFYRFFKRKN